RHQHRLRNHDGAAGVAHAAGQGGHGWRDLPHAYPAAIQYRPQGAAAADSPQCPAAGAPMSRLLHLSDLHFGTEDPEVVAALLQLAREQQPDLCLLSGDITQRARRAQFAAARAFVQQLPAPVLAAPGNHDLPLFHLPLRLLNPYGNYPRAFGPSLEPQRERDDRPLSAGNSTRPARPEERGGPTAQLERVPARLRPSRPGQLRVIMLHHPVCAIQPTDVANLLIGREHASPAWVDAGADLLLAGHIHLPYLTTLGGTSERRAWALQAGTGVSRRVRGTVPNSVNLIEHEAGDGQRRCRISRWDYAREDGRFQLRGEVLELDCSEVGRASCRGG